MRRVRLAALLLAVAAGAGAPANPPADTPAHLGRGPDHVMMWVRDADAATRAARSRLGFRVMPGGDFGDGVANRIVFFSDQSYLELLYLTVPRAEASPAVLEGLDYLRTENGSNGFGILVPSLEQTAARLAADGFAMGSPSNGTWDPDGPGPRPAETSHFRTLNFREPAVPGLGAFFVWYRPYTRWTAPQQARHVSRTSHPNSARRLSAVWFATTAPAPAAAALARLGLARGRPVALPQLGARAVPFGIGMTTVLLMEPIGPGPIAAALARRGPHVAGVSLEVADLETARAIVGQGYGRPMPLRRGVFGRGFVAPSVEDVGLLVEFHEARR